MKKNYISCYQYPTEAILVDDNKNFLKTLEMALGNRVKCRPFEDPEQALKYISKSVARVGTAISKYVPDIAEDIDDYKKSLVVNLLDIHKEIYNKDRFKEIAVIVVDYGMPTMNGLELCKKIRQLAKSPIKIIMLTGEADYELAVQAFNDGLIHQFILKSKKDYFNDVVEAISVLQEKYFFDLSEPIRKSLQPAAQKLFEDKAFIDIFNTIITENNMKEFYILDDAGSLLFMDDKGENPIWLIIKTEEDLEMQYTFASDEKNVPAEILNAIKKREKFAYFPDEKSKIQSAEQWDLRDAKPLGSKKSGLYYAIVKGKEGFPLNREKIATYQNHLKIK